MDRFGNELRVAVAGGDGTILADVWKLRVGRIPLYLLDTNIQENPPVFRDITARLYAGRTPARVSNRNCCWALAACAR